MTKQEVLKMINENLHYINEAKGNLYRGKCFVLADSIRVNGFFKTKRGAEGYKKRNDGFSYYDDYTQEMVSTYYGEIFEIKESELIDITENKYFWFKYLKSNMGIIHAYNSGDEVIYEAKKTNVSEEIMNYIKESIEDIKNNRGLTVVEPVEAIEEVVETVEEQSQQIKEESQNAEEVKAEPETAINNELNIEVKFNAEKNGIELYFNDKPSKEIRNLLKANGFKWSKRMFWYSKKSQKSIDFIESNFNVTYSSGDSMTCSVCGVKVSGINDDRLKRGMCRKHYNQFIAYGETKDTNSNKVNSKNEIIKFEDYAIGKVYDKNSNEKEIFIIDLEDVDKIKDYKWHLNNTGYVETKNKTRLHRFVMNCNDDNLVVDHINHNPLDNRKSNLRICSYSKNSINKVIQSNNTSGVTGVSWHEPSNKWRVRIQVDTKNINIGSFLKFEDAVKARREAEKKYFGEYNPNIESEVKEIEYPEIDINDIESYTVSAELSRRENNNSMFRREDTDHNKEVQELMQDANEEILEALKGNSNPYTEYKAKQFLQSWKKKYYNNYIKRLSHKASNPSWVVTGRGNLDSNRYNKKLSQYDKMIGESVELTNEFNSKISSIKNSIQRQFKEQAKKDTEKLMNTEMELPKFEKKTVKYNPSSIGNIFDGATCDVKTNYYNGYYIFKNWGCWRCYNEKGNEIFRTTTTGSLLEAKKKLIVLLNQKEAI